MAGWSRPVGRPAEPGARSPAQWGVNVLKRGTVLVHLDDQHVVVEGVNKVKKHQKLQIWKQEMLILLKLKQIIR